MALVMILNYCVAFGIIKRWGQSRFSFSLSKSLQLLFIDMKTKTYMLMPFLLAQLGVSCHSNANYIVSPTV